MNILVTGFPYVRKNFVEVFKYYLELDNIFFLLPRSWKVKRGKVVYSPERGKNTFTIQALFHHSNYFLIGGLFKGWMPWFPVFLLIRKRMKIDIVFSAMEPNLLSTLYQGIWTKVFGLKHVIFTWENVHFENKWKGAKGFIQKIILKLNLKIADGIICGNKKAEEIIHDFTDKMTAVIPLSGLDINYFKSLDKTKAQERYNLRGKIVYTFVGAIGYRKGIHLVIRAFGKVLEVIPEARLIIAGSGEYEEKLEIEIKNLRLEDKITRIPWINHQELVVLLSASDVFLYPSLPHRGWAEQFGYSMAEASLMELPVISTRSGSIEEVVLDGKTGLLVEPSDVVSLSDAMVRLGLDLELRARLGKAGREYIVENFSHEIVAKKFYEFFQKINLSR